MTSSSPTAFFRADEITVVQAYFTKKRDRLGLGADATIQLRQARTVPELAAWCGQWLTAPDLDRARTALHQHRHRQKRRGKTARIVIPRRTHDALRQRARQDGSSVVGVINSFLENPHAQQF